MIKHIALLILSWTHLFGDALVWEAPQVLSTPGVNASDPRIGMDASGNLVAAWIENGLVTANTQLFEGSWNDFSVQVSDMGAAELELVVDPSGNATAIWNFNGIIQAASLSFNGTWDTPISLSPPGSSSPQIAVDSEGNLAAIWVCNGIIQSVTKQFNNAWSSIQTPLSYPEMAADSPQIAIGAHKNIVAVWHSTWKGVDAIFSSSTTLNVAWPLYPSLISTPSVPSAYPQVAIDSQDRPIAAWFRYNLSGTNYSNVYVQTVFGNADTTWDNPTDLSSSGVMNPASLTLHVAYNALDMAFVAWTNCYDFTSFNLEGSVYVSNAWIPVITFVTNNIYLYDQYFSISSLGYVYTTFMKYDDLSSTSVIQSFKANTYNVSPNFGTIQTISTTGTNGYPRIKGSVVNQTNYAAAVWLNYNESNSEVQTSIGQVPILPAPTSLAVMQTANNQGLFTEYYNTLSWQGSTPATAANWTIYRNGIWVASVPVETLQWIDHNAVQNQPCVYGVVLQETDGDYSQMSTVAFP
jgi:hypothetical protein